MSDPDEDRVILLDLALLDLLSNVEPALFHTAQSATPRPATEDRYGALLDSIGSICGVMYGDVPTEQPGGGLMLDLCEVGEIVARLGTVPATAHRVLLHVFLAGRPVSQKQLRHALREDFRDRRRTARKPIHKEAGAVRAEERRRLAVSVDIDARLLTDLGLLCKDEDGRVSPNGERQSLAAALVPVFADPASLGQDTRRAFGRAVYGIGGVR